MSCKHIPVSLGPLFGGDCQAPNFVDGVELAVKAVFDHTLVEGEDQACGAGNSRGCLIPSSHGQLLAEPSLGTTVARDVGRITSH